MTFGKKDSSEGSGVLSGSPIKGVGNSNLEAFLNAGSKVQGNLYFVGPVQLDCEIEGEINCKDKLIIGQSALIKGKVVGADIHIYGQVNGDIFASKSLMLKKPAHICGNISTERLGIEEGVLFEGNCSMKVPG